MSPNPFKQKKLRLLHPTPQTRTPREHSRSPLPLHPPRPALLTPQRPNEQRAVLNELFDELVGSLQLNLVTLKALPEIRAVQVGIAEFQSRQPHGTGTASGRRGYVGASGQGGDSRRPRPALGTRDRGERVGTPGDCAEETGPSQPAARAGLPWRADASGLSLPLRGGPTRGSAQGVVIAAHRRCEHRGGGGSGPRPEQESSLAARRHFRQLHSPALLTVFCAVSQKRPAATRAGPGKPSPSADAGSETCKSDPGLGDPPPASALPPLATPPLLPFTLLPPPTGPHFAPGLRAAAAPCAPAFAEGVNPVPSWTPGSL